VQAGHRRILEGRYADAEPAYREALARKEAALGPTNASTLSSLVSLADVLVLQGKLAEATVLLRRVIKARTAALGSRHRETLAVAERLTRVLKAQADQATDKLAREQAAAKQEEVLTPRRRSAEGEAAASAVAAATAVAVAAAAAAATAAAAGPAPPVSPRMRMRVSNAGLVSMDFTADLLQPTSEEVAAQHVR